MRKKVATRRGTGTIRPPCNPPQKQQAHTHIHIHSHSSSYSSQLPKPMARTKTTSRRSSSAPQKEGTSRVNMTKGKRPITDEEPLTSPPFRSTSRPQGRSAPSSRLSKGNKRPFFTSVKEPANHDPVAFKSHFGNHPHSYYDPLHFSSSINFEFHREIVSKRPLCSSYVADLKILVEKGIEFVKNFIYLDRNNFEIRKPVYPDLVRVFYANIYCSKESVHSYVKDHQIYLNKKIIGGALDYYDAGVNADIFKKWDNNLGISHKDVLANICENISLMDGVTSNHRGLDLAKAQLHRLITHILMP
ncbi:hypothetical protein AHAS_Ahas19G0154000 [Arachis hypogaea]